MESFEAERTHPGIPAVFGGQAGVGVCVGNRVGASVAVGFGVSVGTGVSHRWLGHRVGVGEHSAPAAF